jgi:hypothetical protein
MRELLRTLPYWLPTTVTIVVIVLTLWSVYGPPRERCGLRKGARYRVEASFAAGPDQFREGEILIFKLERRNRPWMGDPRTEDTDEPERDLYHFVEVASNTHKTISSEHFSTVEEWIKFLKEVHEEV